MSEAARAVVTSMFFNIELDILMRFLTQYWKIEVDIKLSAQKDYRSLIVSLMFIQGKMDKSDNGNIRVYP